MAAVLESLLSEELSVAAAVRWIAHSAQSSEVTVPTRPQPGPNLLPTETPLLRSPSSGVPGCQPEPSALQLGADAPAARLPQRALQPVLLVAAGWQLTLSLTAASSSG